MTLRTRIVRHRVAALAACSIFATILPLSAVAENGIPAGSGAVITAGQPLLVRATPGWDAEISYEIADGSYVTVWDVAQPAPDGTLWYPVDGGFVPVDAVTSVATLEGGSGFAYFQEAAPATEAWTEPATTEWTEPVAAETGWVDPATGQWVDASTQQTGWVDPNTGEWVEPAAEQAGWVDPATGEWVEPAAQQTGWVDPTTGQWVEPAAAQTGWVDPTTGEWVEPAAEQAGWIDPTTGEWVNGVSLAQEAVTDELVAPVEEIVDPAAEALATEEWVDPAEVAPVTVDPATGEVVEPVADEWTEPVTDEWTEPAPVVEAPVTDEWVEPAPVETGSAGDSWSDPIGTAYIAGTSGDGAACRVAAERGADKLAVLGEGEQVEVRGEAIGEWQPVNCAGMGGYVNTSFISWEPLAVTAEQGRRGRGRGDGGSANGQQMVNFAMQYVGYPYAYAGEGPYAFDCSGFTKFVAQNALGMDITHDMFTQIGMGQSVGMDQLQPGDLVFFSNTFRPGLSHVGIYIGGGQFVHAENESTGVVVSDLNSDYYGSRWSGGTRLA